MTVRVASTWFGARRRLPVLMIALAASSAAVATGSALASTRTVPSTPGPVVQRAANSATADALPTVQVDGVVWSQAVVGNTVYAGGKFDNARPAGAAAGTNLTPRANLLAYDVTTGALITSFAPSLNAQVKAVAASPDGSRVYVGGSFTTANGANRYRIAAYSTASGALISSFAPSLDASVNAIAATNTTVYVGGAFGSANGNARTRLAAFSASNGALLGWSASADNTVQSMVITPDGSELVVSGHFGTVGGQTARGLVALDAANASVRPWAINSVVQDYGQNSAILDLSTDGTTIYGSGYVYGTTTGNLEGTFAADPDTGQVTWIESCHGDSYGIYGTSSSVYVVGHPYDCSSVGGFPEVSGQYRRAIAFTPAATGSNVNSNFDGRPSPSLVDWFPTLAVGSVTGSDQAAWTVTGAKGYVLLGGEFPSVNGVGQQGLVRLAATPTAPGKRGPRLSGTTYPVSVTSSPTPTVSWGANWDQDDLNLAYQVIRDGVTRTPIYTSPSVASTFWTYPSVPAMSYTDTKAGAGTHTYQVLAKDPSGNTAGSSTVTVTVPATLFGSSTPTVGATNGTAAVTVGVKFSSSVAGSLRGVRFWKGSGNTGTHTVSLWSTSGSQLASATVTGETASGWQYATFSNPVTLTPGTSYIASYYAPNGHWAEDDGYFAQARSNPPLSAPVGASVYRYGNGFPNSTYANANFWVDPLFVPSG